MTRTAADFGYGSLCLEDFSRCKPLGEVVITSNARDWLHPLAVSEGLIRHASGDWGDISPEDREENELSLREGYRLMSVYGSGTDRFWIITEADRSYTTVLMPDDY